MIVLKEEVAPSNPMPIRITPRDAKNVVRCVDAQKVVSSS